nr:MAG TPA: hypothetical protein [Caudoviricetes sp.]
MRVGRANVNTLHLMTFHKVLYRHRADQCELQKVEK